MESVNETAVGLKKPLPQTLKAIADEGLEAFIVPAKDSVADLCGVFVRASLAVNPMLSVEGLQAVFWEAIKNGQQRHSDFDSLAEAMLITVLGFVPYVDRITADEMVESVYCVAKHAFFMQVARNRAALLQLPVAGGLQ